MPAIGGSIESITLNGRYFAVTADADGNRKLGGFENELQANGDGTGRLIKTRVPWGVTDIVISVDDDASDHEFLQELADGKAMFPISVTYASGSIYSGQGQITGELQFTNQNTAATLSLAGMLKLTAQ